MYSNNILVGIKHENDGFHENSIRDVVTKH